ncbi:MAG: alpha/beta fold hydrolase [Desulfomonile tiedjei]|uniref:Alpha/beta fold hydrolase n=1 Tax=Desulfomonile tiedjei TaxID=2358 RepID=A0A9D6V091_9BACT|nr:alpha/beta fold hydrolase [Desulfomonile tiedjei]
MPVIAESKYRAPLFFSNPHAQTVFPTLFRKVRGVTYKRERVDTPDKDFLDVDISTVGSTRAAIVLHGLEGDSTRCYMLGMVKALNNNGWDAIAVNLRGCSGEPNRTLRLYHSGDTGDLDTVVSYIHSQKDYSDLALIGFSLGGNVVLKYVGERADTVKSAITAAAAFSVPCDLAAGATKIGSFMNIPYMKRFLTMLREKIRTKMGLFPELINDNDYDQIRDFADFDNRYTAPLHGFANAEDYWKKSSSKQFLARISIPTLLVSAADDPFLTPECYPFKEARDNPSLFLEVPKHGGHVGFMAFDSDREGTKGIWIMRLNGTNQIRITPNGIKAMNPRWSPFLK